MGYSFKVNLQFVKGNKTMIFNFDAINSEYTKILTSYLNKGYVIRPNDMKSVHNNELCHIDLSNPKEPNKCIRIWMNRSKVNITDNLSGYIYTIELIVKEYDIGSQKSYNSLWLEDGVLISNYTLYKIHEGIYENDLEEVLKIIKLRQHRMISKYTCKSNIKIFKIEDLPKAFITSVLKRIHSNYGCKRATVKCITNVVLNKNCHNKFYATIDWTHNTHSGRITIGG